MLNPLMGTGTSLFSASRSVSTVLKYSVVSIDRVIYPPKSGKSFSEDPADSFFVVFKFAFCVKSRVNKGAVKGAISL